MKKPSIPQVPRGDSPQRTLFDSAVKESLEVITGKRGGSVKPLEPDATLAEVVARFNELVARLQ